MLIYVLIFPDDSHVTKRWIDLGLFSFQPSEVIRLILPLSVAAFLTRKELKPKYSDWFISLAAILLVSFLIYKQPDLGTSLIVFTSGFLPVFLTGFPLIFIFFGIAFLGALSPIIFSGLSVYQQQRILTLFDPNADPLGTGWNIAQSKTAIGSGGFFGKGYLSGTQSQLDFIPESHSDFIFAVIAEELGLIGISILFLAYALIIYRIFSIAYRSETIFGRLASASIGFIFLIFILINVSMVVGIIPVVGVPLPLVSQGGTYTLTILDTISNCEQITDIIIPEDTVIPISEAGDSMIITCVVPEVTLDGSNSENGTGIEYLWTTATGNIVSGDSTNSSTVNANTPSGTIAPYFFKICLA